MYLFLTSSPCSDDVPEGSGLPCILNRANGFVSRLRQTMKERTQMLIIAAQPDAPEHNDEMRETFHRAFSYHGLPVERTVMLDARSEDRAEELIAGSAFIMLAGGHVPTQNAFFTRLRLRERLAGCEAVFMGISAGSMNCADVVYAQPEMPGESTDAAYRRFIPGLALTRLNVLPHYQQVKDYTLDGKRLFEDITYGDSVNHAFFALPDGSYILQTPEKAEVFGEAYLIRDKKLSLYCCEGSSRVICQEDVT